MTRRLRFLQLDVFAGRLFDGNPLAVVFDAAGLDTGTMQRIARWTNLSETTFLLPPTQPAADYRVRIFTTRQELPFAGHPSVGSANAAIAAYLQATGGLSAYGRRYRVSQGREVGRDGCVEVSVDPTGPAIMIGGACAIGVRGELLLEDIR